MLPSRCVREAVDELLGLRGEAVILIGIAGEFPAQLAQLARQAPVVEIGQHTGATGVDSVRTDDVGGVRQAVEHFVELGRREIVHIDCGPLPGAVRRRVGCAKTCARTASAAHRSAPVGLHRGIGCAGSPGPAGPPEPARGRAGGRRPVRGRVAANARASRFVRPGGARVAGAMNGWCADHRCVLWIQFSPPRERGVRTGAGVVADGRA